MKKIIKIFLFFFLFIGISFAEETISLRVPYTSKVPVIDGIINDECWQQASVIPHLFITLPQEKFGEISPDETEIFLLYDKQYLYIAFMCSDNKIEEITMPHTSSHDAEWGPDCLEIFLKPDKDGLSYFQIVLFANGSLLDSYYKFPKKQDIEWDSGAITSTYIGNSYWSAEIAIPLAELGLSPLVKDIWRANFVRWQPRSAINQSWALLKNSNHQPEKFNYITGISLDYNIYCIVPEEINWGDMSYGENIFTSTVRCTGNKKIKGVIEVFQDGKLLSRTEKFFLLNTFPIHISLPYIIADKKETKITFSMFDMANNIIYSRSKYFTIPELFYIRKFQNVYYLSEQQMFLNIKVNLSEDSLKKSRLEFIFSDEQGRKKYRTLKTITSKEMKVCLPIYFLNQGESHLIINLINEKDEKISSKEMSVLKIKGFLD